MNHDQTHVFSTYLVSALYVFWLDLLERVFVLIVLVLAALPTRIRTRGKAPTKAVVEIVGGEGVLVICCRH